MTDNRRPIVKNGRLRQLLWIAIVAILLSPLFPAAIRTLGEQSELRGRLAESQVALFNYYFGEK